MCTGNGFISDTVMGLKWVGLRAHAKMFPGPPFLQSNVPRHQRAPFFRENARCQAGVSNVLVNQEGSTDFYRGRVYFTVPTTLKLHFNP